jgi:hypothetical protein
MSRRFTFRLHTDVPDAAPVADDPAGADVEAAASASPAASATATAAVTRRAPAPSDQPVLKFPTGGVHCLCPSLMHRADATDDASAASETTDAVAAAERAIERAEAHILALEHSAERELCDVLAQIMPAADAARRAGSAAPSASPGSDDDGPPNAAA